MHYLWLLAVVILSTITACSTGVDSTRKDIELSIPEPASRKNKSVTAARLPVGANLTLAQAQWLGLSTHPRLQAARHRVAAASGEMVQAGLWPNPQLKVEVEDIATGRRAFSDSELTVSLSQRLPLNGALGLAVRAADQGKSRQKWQYHQQRWQLLADIYLAFYQCLLADARLQQLAKLGQSANNFCSKVQQAVKAGSRPRVDLLRAEVAYATAAMQRDTAQNQRNIVRKRLASLLSLPHSQLPECQGEIFTATNLPPLAQLREKLQRHPQLMEAQGQQRQLQLRKEQAMAARWPNLDLEIGGRHSYSSDENTLLFGVGIDLPVFDRNQGKIAALEAEARAVAAQQRDLSQQLDDRLFAAWNRYRISQAQAQQYRRQILPAASQAVALAEEGYRQGKLSVLAVIDARQTEVRSHLEYLTTLKEMHQAFADVYPLTAVTFYQEEHLNE